MHSSAATVQEYLAELDADRRAAMQTVRATIQRHLPDGYEEAMNWGMICYQVPLRRKPDTYNGQPLMYAALASQKRHMAVYLSGIYADQDLREQFESDYRATGKRLDAGKSCIRFRRLDDLPLEVIGTAVAALSVDTFIERADRARSR